MIAEETIQAFLTVLPVCVVLIPALASFFMYVFSKYIHWKKIGYISVAISSINFILVLVMYPSVIDGGQITYTLISENMVPSISFFIDSFGFVFAMITSLVWLLSTIYAIKYMEHGFSEKRFFSYILIVLAANIGVIVGGNLFTIFIFFELLAILSIGLIVHNQTKQAIEAGNTYIYVSIAAGLMLLLGIMLYYIFTGTLAIEPNLEEFVDIGPFRYLIATLFVLGFGGKAGIFPVHIWLPKAHPVAPSPASAILSGVMVKAGIYGIFRTTGTLLTPKELLGMADGVWSLPEIGYWLIWLALITTTIGWVLALLQDNIKKLLAYSTISQIGYILLGIGCAAFLGFEGAMGFSGSLYHVINHALYKSCLFLVAGIIYYKFHTIDMNEIGGLWRRMPYTTLISFIAVFGIIGMPLFNGYISKTLLHHAIVEAYEFTSTSSLYYAEIIFTIAGGGTLAYYLKFLTFTFFGNPSDEVKKQDRIKESKIMIVPMALLASMILLIGVFPNVLMDYIVLPVLHSHQLDPVFIEEYIKNISFFTVKDLLAISKSFAIGFLLFGSMHYYNLWNIKHPKKITTLYISEKLSNVFVSSICRNSIKCLEDKFQFFVDKLYAKLIKVIHYPYPISRYFVEYIIYKDEGPYLGIKEKIINVQKKEKSVNPELGMIDFAIFLVAFMLAVYLIIGIA